MNTFKPPTILFFLLACASLSACSLAGNPIRVTDGRYPSVYVKNSIIIKSQYALMPDIYIPGSSKFIAKTADNHGYLLYCGIVMPTDGTAIQKCFHIYNGSIWWPNGYGNSWKSSYAPGEITFSGPSGRLRASSSP